MSDQNIDTPDLTAPRASASGRRALLVAGATAALGAAAVATARQADAAAGSVMYVGKTNDSGASSTILKVTSASTGFKVYQYGSAFAFFASGNIGNGAGGGTMAAAAAGVVAQNMAASTGSGSALFADGRNNIAVKASTLASVTDVPAMYGVGGAGAGVALQAYGRSLLDGDCMALNNWVGILDHTQALTYAPVASGQDAYHQVCGTAVLSAGSATVTLPADVLSAIDMDTLTVQCTAVAVAMPNLYVTVGSSGFTISGGVGSGSVFWTATAIRPGLDMSATAAAKVAAGALATARKVPKKGVVARPQLAAGLGG